MNSWFELIKMFKAMNPPGSTPAIDTTRRLLQYPKMNIMIFDNACFYVSPSPLSLPVLCLSQSSVVEQFIFFPNKQYQSFQQVIYSYKDGTLTTLFLTSLSKEFFDGNPELVQRNLIEMEEWKEGCCHEEQKEV